MSLKFDLTVAAIAEDRGRFLFVQERAARRVVLNQPAGHLEPGFDCRLDPGGKLVGKLTAQHSLHPHRLVHQFLSNSSLRPLEHRWCKDLRDPAGVFNARRSTVDGVRGWTALPSQTPGGIGFLQTAPGPGQHQGRPPVVGQPVCIARQSLDGDVIDGQKMVVYDQDVPHAGSRRD